MFKIILFLIFVFLCNSLYALDIPTTIKSTIENNPKIKIGLEKINEAKELINKASGELLPDISSSITGTLESSNTKTTSSTTEDDTFADKYKLTITKNLYDAGIDKLEIERSKILFQNEIINFNILLENLIIDAITGYLTVLNYESSLTANQKNFEFLNKLLEETKTKYDLGSATIYDLQKAESSFSMSEANLFAAQQNLEIAKKSFKLIVSKEAINLDNLIEINDNINLNNIEENALKNNLSFSLIKNDIKNKNILLLKEKKSKKPYLDLTGTAEYSDSDRIDSGTETMKGNLAITLTIPIFQQGIDNSNIRKYFSQILQSEIELDDKTDELLLSISNTYKDFLINKSLMKANAYSMKAYKTSLESLNQEYLLGTKSITDLLEDEENLLNYTVNFSNSNKDYLISYFKILSLEGSLLDNFSEYLPKLE